MPKKNHRSAHSLQFRDPTNPAVGGEIILHKDRTIQLLPTPPLRAELEHIVDVVDTATLKWGTSLVVGLAAVGAAAFLRGKRGIGYSLFVASGLVGAGGYGGRRYVRSIPPWLLSPIPVDEIKIAFEPDRGLRFVVSGRGLRKLVVVLKSGDFDAGEASAFLAAFADSLERK